MSEQDILNLIIKLVGTSIPGYLSFYILTRSNLIETSKNRSEENKIFLAILSTMNIFIGLLVINKYNSNNIAWITLLVILMMSVFSAFIIPFVTPFISNSMTKYINFLRDRNSKPEIEQESRYKQIFDHKGTVRVAIFDFSRNYIASGVLGKAPLDNEFEYFDIILDYHVDENEAPKQSKFVKNFKELEKDKLGKYFLYIDFEKKINIHVFHEGSSSSI